MAESSIERLRAALLERSQQSGTETIEQAGSAIDRLRQAQKDVEFNQIYNDVLKRYENPVAELQFKGIKASPIAQQFFSQQMLTTAKADAADTAGKIKEVLKLQNPEKSKQIESIMKSEDSFPTMILRLNSELSEEGTETEKEKKVDVNKYFELLKPSTKKLDWIDALKAVGDDPVQLIPFISGAKQIKDIAEVAWAAEQLKNGVADQEDVVLLQEYIQKMEQDRTWGNKVASIITQLPAFMGEFLATGPLYRAGSTIAKEGIEQGLKWALGKSAQKLLANRAAQLGIRIAGGLAGTAARLPVAGALRITAGTVEDLMPELEFKEIRKDIDINPFATKTIVTAKENETPVLDAIGKNVLDNYIEFASEITGGAITRILGKLANPVKEKLLKIGFLKALAKLNPGKPIGKAKEILDKAEWHGPIGELGEERVGSIARMATGLEDWELPDFDQWGAEITAFSITQVGFSSMGQARQKQLKKKWEAQKTESHEELLEDIMKGIEEPTKVGEVVEVDLKPAEPLPEEEVKKEKVTEVAPAEVKEEIVPAQIEDIRRNKKVIDKGWVIQKGSHSADLTKGTVLDLSKEGKSKKVDKTEKIEGGGIARYVPGEAIIQDHIYQVRRKGEDQFFKAEDVGETSFGLREISKEQVESETGAKVKLHKEVSRSEAQKQRDAAGAGGREAIKEFDKLTKEAGVEIEDIEAQRINEQDLRVGDAFTIRGEKFVVAKRTKEGVELQDGHKIKLEDFAAIDIDAGSLVKESAESRVATAREEEELKAKTPLSEWIPGEAKEIDGKKFETAVIPDTNIEALLIPVTLEEVEKQKIILNEIQYDFDRESDVIYYEKGKSPIKQLETGKLELGVEEKKPAKPVEKPEPTKEPAPTVEQEELINEVDLTGQQDIEIQAKADKAEVSKRIKENREAIDNVKLFKGLTDAELADIKFIRPLLDSIRKRLEKTDIFASDPKMKDLKAAENIINKIYPLPERKPFISDEDYNDAKKRSIDRLDNQITTGVDATAYYDLVRMGAYHLERGVVKLGDFMRKMKTDLGNVFDKFTHRLVDIWNSAKRYLVHRERNGNTETPDEEITDQEAQTEASNPVKDLNEDFAAILDSYHTNRDIKIQEGRSLALKLQRELIEALGEKKYNKNVEKYDQAIQIWIDLLDTPKKVVDEFFRVKAPEELEAQGYTNNLSEEQMELVELSQNLPKEVKEVAEKLRENNELQGKWAEQNNLITNAKVNYTMRLWKQPAKEGRLEASIRRKFGTATPRAKPRVYDNVLEGWSMGKELRIKTGTNAMPVANEELAKTLEDRMLLSMLTKAGIIKHKGLQGWSKINHPNFTKMRWVGTLEEGELYGEDFFVAPDGNVFKRDPLYAPDEFAKRLNNILGSSKLRGQSAILDELMRYNLELKHMVLTISFYHHQAFLRSYYLGGALGADIRNHRIVKAYKTGIEAIENFTPELKLLVGGGLTLGETLDFSELHDWKNQDQTKLGEILDKIPGASQIKDKLLAVRDHQTDFLFNRLGPGLKAQAALLEYRSMRKKHEAELRSGELTEHDVAKMVATLMNDDFGGLHLQRLERNQTVQDIFRFMALAPDWTESNVRSMLKAARVLYKGKDGKWHIDRTAETKMYRKFWVRIASKGLIATAVFNALMASLDDDEDFYSTFRKAWTAGRLKWLEVDITPLVDRLGMRNTDSKYYFSILGHFKDPIKFTVHPVQSAKHKGSMAFGIAQDIISGTDWSGARFTTFSELLGVDDKGVYKTTRRGKYKKGDPKGGKFKGKLTARDFGKEGIGFTQVPSFLLHTIRGRAIPIPLQSAIGALTGEMDTFIAVGRSLGMMVSQTYGHTNIEFLLSQSSKRIFNKKQEKEFMALVESADLTTQAKNRKKNEFFANQEKLSAEDK